MAVIVGSARSSFGNTSPGDQNGGKEVSTQAWYLHSKGWYVYRAKDPAAREKIAEAMEKACANDDIGYSQPTRDMLWNDVKVSGYDPSKTTKKVNTDCSALVRVCCAYAGIMLGDFITSNEGAVLVNSGKFDKLTADKYCKQSDYLMRGDILCTRTKGHTVVVLTDGKKVKSESISTPDPEPTPEPTPTPATNGKTVEVTGASVNIRFGPGTEYGVVKIVKNGDKFKAVDTDGWRPIVVGNVVCWISEKYSKQV